MSIKNLCHGWCDVMGPKFQNVESDFTLLLLWLSISLIDNENMGQYTEEWCIEILDKRNRRYLTVTKQ